MNKKEIAEMARSLDHACMSAMELENRTLRAEHAAFMADAARLVERNGGPIGGYINGAWFEDGYVMVRRVDFDALALAVKAGKPK